MPLSTSVKSITGWPAASCSRTISSPLIFQAVMSLVNGSAAAQPGSSSSLSPCDDASLAALGGGQLPLTDHVLLQGRGVLRRDLRREPEQRRQRCRHDARAR